MSKEKKCGNNCDACKFSGKKQIDIIREKCEENGLNIYDVFREAVVPIHTVTNWKTKEPDAFKTVEKINQAIERLKSK